MSNPQIRDDLNKGIGDSANSDRSLAIAQCDDHFEIRKKYRPFLLSTTTTDWVNELELDSVMTMAEHNMTSTGERLKVLVLFGSLRRRLVITANTSTC